MDFEVERSTTTAPAEHIVVRLHGEAVGEMVIVNQSGHYLVGTYAAILPEGEHDMAAHQKRVMTELLKQAAEVARDNGGKSITFINDEYYLEILEGAGFDKNIGVDVWTLQL